MSEAEFGNYSTDSTNGPRDSDGDNDDVALGDETIDEELPIGTIQSFTHDGALRDGDLERVVHDNSFTNHDNNVIPNDADFDDVGDTRNGIPMDNDSCQDHDNMFTENPTPAAREHTYLPGASHPLFPETMLSQRRRLRMSSSIAEDCYHGKRNRTHHDLSSQGKKGQYSSHPSHSVAPTAWKDDSYHRNEKDTNPWMELAILEVQNVVLFPGSTIPLRLQHPAWIDYVGRKIDASRMVRGITTTSTSSSSAPTDEVRLGILTHHQHHMESNRNSSLRRSSWMRTGIHRQQGQRLSQLLQEILMNNSGDDDDDDDDNNDNEQNESLEENDNHASMPIGERQHDNHNPDTRQNRLIGKIGTIATITYTHGDEQGMEDNDDSWVPADGGTTTGDNHHETWSRVWQSHRRGQIIVTALGTGRFRIVSRVDDTTMTNMVPIYHVEELRVDNPFQYPSMSVWHKKKTCGQQHSSRKHSSWSTSHYLNTQEQRIQHLATITPIPYFAYRLIWPWRMVGLIRLALDEIDDFQGLRNALPKLDSSEANDSTLLEPVNFSFWMSSNMPFSEEEKIQLLNMITPSERLNFIYKKIRRRHGIPNTICCRWCGLPLATVASMFTVGGAEGTTGAYVNEHGIIHQTITLRQVDETCVFYIGGPETKDSWFPGYSWTITSCRSCGSHLGWKFTRVADSTRPRSEEQDEPLLFFGMSAGSIRSMFIRSRSRR